MDAVTLGLAKKYTDNSISGISGSLAGKNCTIKKTEKVTDATRVTFEWTANDGTTKTTSIDVPDGAKGDKGDTGEQGIQGVKGDTGAKGETGAQGTSISSCAFNAEGKLVITLSDGTELPPLDMPTTAVEVSKEAGNIVVQKADGMYAPATDISGKVDKVEGKGLSTNDYDNTEKAEVAKIANKVDKVEGKGLSTVDFTDTDYVHTDNNYTSAEKAKLSGIDAGANKTVVDSALSSTSENPVQNKVIKNAMGSANGFATLDENGKLTSSQMPTSSRQIVGELDTATDHSLPNIANYNPGDELIVTTSGYIVQSTSFTLKAGNVLTKMEVDQANKLITAGFVFTLKKGATTLGTVKTFATNKVTLSDDTVINLPYASDLSAESTPSSVQIATKIGDEFMNIDNHWVHLSNTSNVDSVNRKGGAVILGASDVGAIGADKLVTSFSATTSDSNVPSEKLVKTELDKMISNEDFKKYVAYSRNVFIDQINGDDNNDGLTAATALKTANNLLYREAHKSYTIKIVGDYTGEIILPRADFIYLASSSTNKTINGRVLADNIGYLYGSSLNINCTDSTKNAFSGDGSNVMLYDCTIQGGSSGIYSARGQLSLRKVTIQNSTIGISAATSLVSDYSDYGFTIKDCTTGIKAEGSTVFINSSLSSLSGNTTDYNDAQGEIVIDGVSRKVKSDIASINNTLSENKAYLSQNGENYFDFSKTVKRAGTVVISGDSVRVYSESEQAYTASCTPMTDLIIGGKYKLSADIVITSGIGRLAVRYASDTICASTGNITVDGHYELTFTHIDSSNYISLFGSWTPKSVGNVTYNNVKLELLTPSNCTLETQNNDLKMLGWTVPAECPIQNHVSQNFINNDIYYQRVGRVDLGSLNWEYITDNGWFQVGFTAKSNKIYTTKYVTSENPMPDRSIQYVSSFLVIKDSSYTDADTFKTSLKGTYLYYELETVIKSVDGNEYVIKELSNKIPNKTFSLTNGSNFVIDLNTSYYITDKVVNIAFVGHATKDITNSDIVTYTENVNLCSTFASGVGNSRWSIDGVTYTFINKNGIITNLSSGKYIHVNATMILE